MAINELPGVIYLHGLGSSPDSPKGRLIAEYLNARGYETRRPYLSLPCLAELSVERSLGEVVRCFGEFPREQGVVLIGSSFGGFLALQALARLCSEDARRVRALILLAPLLFPWHQEFGVINPGLEAQWRHNGAFPIEEGASGKMVNVHVSFLDELRHFRTEDVHPSIPTLIIHGARDESVPVRQSEVFSSQNRGVTLVKIDDGHQLLQEPQKLLSLITEFLESVSTGVA